MAALIVVADGMASVASQSQSAAPGSGVAIVDWQVDSLDAVTTLRLHGGDLFLKENGQATLILTLSNRDQPKWEAVLFANQNGRSMSVVIDANDGSILSSS